MSDEAEKLILGDTAVAAATEPRRFRLFSRRRKAEPPPLPYCENCGANMSGPFCAQCGQHAVDYRRSFGKVFGDILDSFLNWDSKFFATLGLLISQPWRLTNDFLRGKRVRYVHPLRLYLLISVAFFFGVHQLAKHAQFDKRSEPRAMTAEERAKFDAKMTRLNPEVRAQINAALDEAEKQGKRDASPSPSPAPSTTAPDALPSPADKTPEADANLKVNGAPFVHFGPDRHAPQTPFEQWLEGRLKSKIGENGINAKTFMLAVTNNLPAMMLCCIPLFAFVLKLLYIRRRVFYIDHLIYALHIHAFAYLAILVIGFVIAFAHVFGAFGGWLIAALIITAVTLLFLSIRRVYRQSWIASFAKFAFGGFAYVLVLAVALAATFLVTLALPD